METMTDTTTTRATPKGARTCVGCQEADAREALVRLVVDGEGDATTVVVDAAGGAFGRGVHVHPRPDCIEKATKGGLARSLKVNVKIKPADLANEIGAAFGRRASGLLASAKRAKKVAMGADASVQALAETPHAVVVVATDAAHASTLGPVQRAVVEGRAVAWLDRNELGAIFGRADVAVCAVTDARIGAELTHACQTRASVSSLGTDSRGEACRSREVR